MIDIATTSRSIILLFSLLFAVYMPVAGNDIPAPPVGRNVLLHQDWKARQAAYVLLDGAQLSSGKSGFNGWMKATVPGTVLTTLLDNQLIPSPYYGMDNELIPDIYHTGNDFYTYWFVNQFQLAGADKNVRLWLNFRGINYKAEIFLNGKRISATTHEGMFIRRQYEVTRYVKHDSVNTLAVLVLPPDFPGEANGGQGGDGQIARNVTMHFTPGWDWIQAVKDRNTGIWDEVSLSASRDIRLLHPQVVTGVPGVRIPGDKQGNATVMVQTEVENLSSEPQSVSVAYEVEGRKLSAKVRLAPREKRQVRLPVMEIRNPRLWWPNNMGKQELYDMNISISDASGNLSDRQDIRFGIREISTEKDPATGGRKFYVNGQKIFIRGGNYIASDWMLRLSPERYRTEVRFHADMNLNMIRVWGGALPERPEFYNACDEYGILVFQDLSVTGDANGAWTDPRKKDSRERRHEYPDNHQLFLESVIDQVKMLRNHPSLCIWCGGNEWPPAADILDELQHLMPLYDNTRHFAAFSTDTVFTRNTIGGVGDGPYGIQEPEWFFTFRSTPFNPELGSVGVPEASAMRAIMDETDLNDFPRPDKPVNKVWAYHKYIPYGRHIERYAEPQSGEEFCNIAQLLNFEQYRALMEGWASNMWNWYTGMIIWKTQNPWTALRGQMYDYYLDVNACYYGIKEGGKPVHAQYNMGTGYVEVVNTTLTDRNQCMLRARVYDPGGKVLSIREENVNLKANMSEAVFEMVQPVQVNGVYFLRLELLDGQQVFSDNTYWLTTLPIDYTGLKDMAASSAAVSVKTDRDHSQYKVQVKLKTKDRISFFNRISVLNRKTGERVLPVYYSDNYFTVFPNEEKEILLTFECNLPEEDIEVEVKSWNDGKYNVTR